MVRAVHDIGDSRRLRADFTDINGNATDPTTVTLTIREPDGTLVTKTDAELSNPQVGQWTFDYTITKPGRHIVRWEGTGALVTAEEAEFYARRKEA